MIPAGPSRARGSVVALALAGAIAAQAVAFGIRVSAALLTRAEVGYGDSYVLHDVLHFLSTGQIYRPAGEYPLTPALYGPFLYYLLSLPLWGAEGPSPFLGARLTILASVLVCCVLCASITYRLSRKPTLATLALLLPLAVSFLGFWACQLRSDFVGSAIELLSIRLVLSRRRRWLPVAGAIGVLAFFFKSTFVAVPAAVVIWYLLRRRLVEASLYAAGAAVSGVTILLALIAVEPEMIRHLTTLTDPIIDNQGAYDLVRRLFQEPVVLLCVAGIASKGVRRGLGSHWGLLTLGAGFSLFLAAVTCRQAGANMNYFIEPILVVVPLGCIAAAQLIRLSCQSTSLAALLFAGLMVGLTEPATLSAQDSLRRIRNEAARNPQIERLEIVLRDRVVFSEIGRYSLATRAEPILTEPFLANYLEQQGAFDPAPVVAELQRGTFDLVITRRAPLSYRGVGFLSPTVLREIQARYAPYCTYLDAVIQLKQGDSQPTLERELTDMGCRPVTPTNGGA